MSRSRKKPFTWISKGWDKFQERGFRRKLKQVCHEIEIDFDPDRDWEEANLNVSNKKLGDWGTRCGWEVPPGEDDDTWMHEDYEKMKRK